MAIATYMQEEVIHHFHVIVSHYTPIIEFKNSHSIRDRVNFLLATTAEQKAKVRALNGRPCPQTFA